MDFLISSEKEVMYERASVIEFFFSVRIVVNSDMEVPSKVSTLMAMISLPVSDLVMRCKKPGILYNFPKQDLIVNPRLRLLRLFATGVMSPLLVYFYIILRT